MGMNLETCLIAHCAPTLASLKTASLFCLTVPDGEELEEQVRAWNSLLNGKGLFVTVLRRGTVKALIYVCRLSHLRADLQKPGVAEFLAGYGYRDMGAEAALNRLKIRLGEAAEFPHEIGVFLGYPLEDVEGFIRHGGKNCRCAGCWKVYGDADEAEKRFARFRKCREIYARLWNQGRSVWQLTVAA